MLNEEERARLALYQTLGTLTQAQALEYHELLNKEVKEVVEPKELKPEVKEDEEKKPRKKFFK